VKEILDTREAFAILEVDYWALLRRKGTDSFDICTIWRHIPGYSTREFSPSVDGNGSLPVDCLRDNYADSGPFAIRQYFCTLTRTWVR
jgi:hypothetical protein